MLRDSITVLNRSNKVVSNGKHLGGVWREAKAAYQSRKAELKAERDRDYDYRRAQSELGRLSVSEEHLPRRKPASRAGSSRSVARSRTGAPANQRRASPHYEYERERERDHGHGSGSRREHQSRASAAGRPRRPNESMHRAYTELPHANDSVYSHPDSAPSGERPDRQLARRNTTPAKGANGPYDEDLAYGELPPLHHMPVRPSDAELELKGKMTVLNRLLEEANCLQYSASSMIEHLQRNPDALAAVGLTLAEISTLGRKVGPAAFANMKTMFPGAIALLASPQFLIAGGLAVGVTVVMLGGYKIIKRNKAQRALSASGSQLNDMDELREIEGELSGIEMWRRGIADAHEESVGTSVDGEFITPHAAQRQIAEGVLRESDLKPGLKRAQSERSHRSSRSRHHHRSSTGAAAAGPSGAAGPVARRGSRLVQTVDGAHDAYADGDHDATTAGARSERSTGSRSRRHSGQHGTSGSSGGHGRSTGSRLAPAREDDRASRAGSSASARRRSEQQRSSAEVRPSTARRAVGGLKMLFKGRSSASVR